MKNFMYSIGKKAIIASKNKVKKARKKIAEAIRNKMGKEFIILANTGWYKDRDTHNFINGVFLELSKWVSGRTEGKYSCNEILYIEKLIKLHDQHLSEPRIIAVGAKKITKPFSNCAILFSTKDCVSISFSVSDILFSKISIYHY